MPDQEILFDPMKFNLKEDRTFSKELLTLKLKSVNSIDKLTIVDTVTGYKLQNEKDFNILRIN